MDTPEAKVKKKVKEFLHSRKVQSLTHPIEGAVGFYWMPVVGGYGSPFLDFVINYKGRFIALETKAPGKYLTPRQHILCNMLVETNAHCCVSDSAEGCIQALTSAFSSYD